MAILNALPPWPFKVDGGVVLLVAALFLATVLAHRFWRAKIRLEDELEARAVDLERVYDRYRTAFRSLPAAAAFADRVTGLVMEATPGWTGCGLPEPGRPVFGTDPALEKNWKAIPPPGPDHTPAPPQTVPVQGATVTATCLGGASLGVVLLTPLGG
jgi:hypothetical protein